MMLVLDVGSGASLPDADTAHRFVDAIKAVDSGKHDIVLKAQLFTSAPPNTPLAMETFIALWARGREAGYGVTASVFDVTSLQRLLGVTPIPFLKIACRKELYWLAGEVPRKIPVYVSWDCRQPVDSTIPGLLDGCHLLACVPEYPATIAQYGRSLLGWAGVSDHTEGWDLFQEWSPVVDVWEKHIVLPDTKGPDVGPWACTPQTLREIM